MSTVTIDQMSSVIGRAATDSAFRQQLLADPSGTLQNAGISIPSGAKVKVVEDSQTLRYLVVPSRPSGVSDADLATIASESLPDGTSVQDDIASYAQLVAASWTDGSLRSKLLSDPAATLSAHGISVPSGVKVQAVESNENSLVLAVPPASTASSTSGTSVGDIASSVNSSFTSLTKLITAGSYLAGLGFATGSILKFKQHKDNPTQVPIGTPIALVFIAAALTFLPSILDTKTT